MECKLCSNLYYTLLVSQKWGLGMAIEFFLFLSFHLNSKSIHYTNAYYTHPYLHLFLLPKQAPLLLLLISLHTTRFPFFHTRATSIFFSSWLVSWICYHYIAIKEKREGKVTVDWKISFKKSKRTVANILSPPLFKLEESIMYWHPAPAPIFRAVSFFTKYPYFKEHKKLYARISLFLVIHFPSCRQSPFTSNFFENM